MTIAKSDSDSDIVTTERKSRKRRRQFHCARSKTDRTRSPISTHSFLITILLAAFAVAVQGETRTLRHNRSSKKQQEQKLPRIGQQQRQRQRQRQRQNQREVSESRSRLRSDIQYGIGKHPNNKQASEVEVVSVRKSTRNDSSVNVIDNGEEFAEDQYQNNKNTNGYSAYFTNVDSGKKNKINSGGAIIKPIFHDSGETDVLNNYAIGNGWNKQKSMRKYTEHTYQYSPMMRAEAPDHDVMSDESKCLFPDYECCEISDCNHGGDVCVNRHCIDDGYFRFTLHWIGDDDYDLFVVTPDGTEISYNNVADPVSFGKFGEEMAQEENGYHVENIYFPIEGGPPGVYRFFIRPFLTVGRSDKWTITVVLDGEIVISESGVGASEAFYCRKDPQPTPSTTTMFPTKSPLQIILPPSSHPTPTIVSPVEHPNRPPIGQERPSLGIKPTLSPISLPSLSPTKECSIASGDECCVTSDCNNSESLCEQRTCIREGDPRVTLTWTGDEDLDLFVITPDGVQISASNTYDMFSGGTFEQSTTDQNSLGYHVENVYFPTKSSPNGTYEYGVRSSAKSYVGDSWSIEIHDEGRLVNKEFGSGDSVTFTHFRKGGGDGPQRPNPQPSRCSPVEEECCIDADCSGASGDLCVQRTCINEGSLRITLEWIGDDNLELNVETPTKMTISESLKFDAVSGARYESSEQSPFGFHVKSVYFPSSGAPIGTYDINIDAVSVRGIGGDIWTMRVYENGKMKLEEVGIGDSSVFRYELESGFPIATITPTISPQLPTAIPIATMKPTISPQLPTDGCDSCTDNLDCMKDQSCVGNVCIYEGNPMFTLQWPGKSMYSLTVVTPNGKYISAFSPFDPDSGGTFEGPTQQRLSGDDVENIYFSIEGGPLGLYTYYVTNSGGGVSKEIWSVTITVNDKIVARQRGSDKSDSFIFQYRGVDEHNEDVTLAPVPAPSTPDQEGCNPRGAECCKNSNCSSDELCSFGLCVKKGAPQFLLSWEGNYDVALAIVTPEGKKISWDDRHDGESGGKFDEHIDTEKNRRIENVYFAPNNGPVGVYPYYIHSYQTESEDDAWTLGIYVDGKEVSTKNGQGSSEVFFFYYSGKTSISDGVQEEKVSDDLSAGVQEEEISKGPFAGMQEEDACDPLTISDSECCSDSECFANEACASRTCVDDGNPRFTLSWEGANDLDLLVVTPLGKTISLSNMEDSESGGKFGENFDQYEYGLHVENIYFPMDGGPVGNYSFYVRSFLANGGDDEWTVGVYVKGKLQYSVRGTGNSEKLAYTLLPLTSYKT